MVEEEEPVLVDAEVVLGAVGAGQEVLGTGTVRTDVDVTVAAAIVLPLPHDLE